MNKNEATTIWARFANEQELAEYARLDQLAKEGVNGKRAIRQRCLARAARESVKPTVKPVL